MGDMAPVTPSQIEALIINDNDDLFCVAIPKLFQAFYLYWKFMKWAVAEDGSIATGQNTLGQAICDTNCET